MNKFEKYRSVYESYWRLPIKYCTEVPGKKNTSFVIMESEPEEFNAGCVSFASVKEVLEKLGWTDISSIDTNGWDIDYWVTFIKEGKDFNYIVSGNLYYGNINIRKEKF